MKLQKNTLVEFGHCIYRVVGITSKKNVKLKAIDWKENITIYHDVFVKDARILDEDEVEKVKASIRKRREEKEKKEKRNRENGKY